MPNSINSQYIAFTHSQVGKIHQSISYAQAILNLIRHNSTNNNGDEADEFFTNTETIKTAISAAQHFLNVAEENGKGIYFSIEQEAFKAGTAAKLRRIENQRLQQELGGEND